MLELGGLTLLERAIWKCIESKYVDAIAVNTDIDVTDIQATYAQKPHKMILWIPRPPALAGPDVSKWPVYQDSVTAFEKITKGRVVAAVDVDVSRPLTTTADLDNAIDAWLESDASMLLAVCHARKTPYQDIYEYDMAGNLMPSKPYPTKVVCRQDAPPCWYHGGIFVMDRNALLGTDEMWDAPVDGYVIDEDHCHDIDTPADWQIVRALAGVPA